MSKTYNKKAFLLPGSIRSAAMYHAKVKDDGEYMFRIHDCITGIRLRGNLNDPEEVEEAVEKLRQLSLAPDEFAGFIERSYKSVEKRKAEIDRLREAAEPLVKLLCEEYHPHCTAIVTPTCVEVLEGAIHVAITDFI